MPMGMGPEGSDEGARELHEVYLPAHVLNICLPGWETADDTELSQAVGETMDHADWHWRWLVAIRLHKCRLAVVQHRNVDGQPMLPHYQIGDLFTLSHWHPERALAEAQTLMNEGAEGLAFDLPVNDEMKQEWLELAKAAGLDLSDDDGDPDAPGAFDVIISAMVLLDDGHDRYVAELGEDFYIATRGLRRDIDKLLLDEFGRWSAETMQVTDRTATVRDMYIFPEDAPGLEALQKPVPVVYPPAVSLEDGDPGSPFDDDEDDVALLVRRPQHIKLN